MPDRRVSRAPEVVPPLRRVDAGRAARRALLESIAARAIAALDAMDAPGFDLEAEPDDDNDAELSAQSATLAPDRTPARRIRRRARAFVWPSPYPRDERPQGPGRPAPRPVPAFPAQPVAVPALAPLFGITRDTLEAHPDGELLVWCATYEDALTSVERAADAIPATGAAEREWSMLQVHQRAAEGILAALDKIQPTTVAGLVAKAGAIRGGLLMHGPEPEGAETAAAFTLLRQIAEGPWA